MNGKTRIRDIAEKAGVSPATVSNVLHHRKGASPSVAQRIRDLAAAMNYEAPVSGPTGQHIRLVISRKHGLVVADTQFFVELIGGIEAECRANRLDLMVTNLKMDGSPTCRQQIAEICAETCAGIILLATELPNADIRNFENCRAPLLILDNSIPHIALNTVSIDNREAGYKAASELIRAGHTDIGYIGSKPDFNNMVERRKGFSECLKEHGIACSREDDIYLTPTIDGAFEDMDRILTGTDRNIRSAYFAANDILAIGAMRALQKHGFRLPEDVSIIGMDDLSLCGIVTPNLSSIHVPRAEMGRTAVRRIISEDCCITTTFVDVAFVGRESVRNL